MLYPYFVTTCRMFIFGRRRTRLTVTRGNSPRSHAAYSFTNFCISGYSSPVFTNTRFSSHGGVLKLAKYRAARYASTVLSFPPEQLT